MNQNARWNSEKYCYVALVEWYRVKLQYTEKLLSTVRRDYRDDKWKYGQTNMTVDKNVMFYLK